MHSAYRKHHSTETTLLRVTNGILWTIDRRQDVVLVLLDLSAAFDTIDHAILVERLTLVSQNWLYVSSDLTLKTVGNQ